jgi:hypothetical protein
MNFLVAIHYYGFLYIFRRVRVVNLVTCANIIIYNIVNGLFAMPMILRDIVHVHDRSEKSLIHFQINHSFPESVNR